MAPPDSAGPTDHPLVHALAGRDHMDALAQFLQSARAEPSVVAREPRVGKGPQSRVQPRPVADLPARLRGRRTTVVRPERGHCGEDLVSAAGLP